MFVLTTSLLCLGSLLAEALAPYEAGARARVTPHGRVLVVTANLEEAFGTRDVRRHGDMRTFVRRLMTLSNYKPDVLLLQEVRRRSARFVARRLTRRTGHRYFVAVDPGNDPWWQTRRAVFKRETAILLNRRTMRRASRGGFMSTSHAGWRSYDGSKRQVKKSAFLLARERGARMRLSLASVHFPGKMRTAEMAHRLKRRWSRKVVRGLQRRYPFGSRYRIGAIGGDFNSGRGRRTASGDVRPYPFWRLLTRRRRYKDSVHVVNQRPDVYRIGGVDYVFARARVINAWVDMNYDRIRARGTKSYYSDHRFRWALLGLR